MNGWFQTPPTLDEQMAAEYAMDNLTGATARVHRPVRTPVRISRRAFNDEYVPDQIASWRANKIAEMRSAER